MVKAAVHKTATYYLAKVQKSLNQHLCLVVEVSPGIPEGLGILVIQTGKLSCTMAPFWNSCGFHNDEQSVQVVRAWSYLALVRDMGWKHI